MFQADTAFALELIAVGFGFWILLKTRNAEIGNLKGLGSFIGYFIIVSAFLTLLCTSYYTMRYWEDGHFNKPVSGQMMMGGMHKISGCDYSMMSGHMDGDQCNRMMGNNSSDGKCGKMMKGKMNGMKESQCKMMKGGMGKMMDNESKMSNHENHEDHHPEMTDEE